MPATTKSRRRPRFGLRPMHQVAWFSAVKKAPRITATKARMRMPQTQINLVSPCAPILLRSQSRKNRPRHLVLAQVWRKVTQTNKEKYSSRMVNQWAKLVSIEKAVLVLVSTTSNIMPVAQTCQDTTVVKRQ